MDSGITEVKVPLPLIRGIVPSYNRAGLVRRCYDSVVAQRHRPLEFLLADDVSTDDIAAALPPVNGFFVRYFRQPTNQVGLPERMRVSMLCQTFIAEPK
jgi:hypothetical protein